MLYRLSYPGSINAILQADITKLKYFLGNYLEGYVCGTKRDWYVWEKTHLAVGLMETPLISQNFIFQDDTEIQDLLKQLNDAKTELQLTKDEVDQVNKDVNKCREEMDRRIMMMVQMDEGLWNSLLEQDALMQEKKSLTSQLEEVTLTSSVESKQALVRSLQEEKSGLMEQERNLKLKREQLMKALAEASSNIEEVSQGENQGKPGSSRQSKSTEKPVRKRRARK